MVIQKINLLKKERGRIHLSGCVLFLCGKTCLLGKLGNNVLQVLTDLELNHGAVGNSHVPAGVLGVATHLGFHFLGAESTEVAEHNSIAIAYGFRDAIHHLLNNLQYVCLCAAIVELSTHHTYEFSLCDRSHKCKKIVWVIIGIAPDEAKFFELKSPLLDNKNDLTKRK